MKKAPANTRKRYHHYSTIIGCIFLLSLLAVSVGCSKKTATETLSNQNIFEIPLLKKLPQTTVGFLAWNYDSPHYTDFVTTFSQSTNKHQTSLVDQLKTLTENSGELKPIQNLIKWMLEEEFIETEPGKPQPLQNGLGILDIPEMVTQNKDSLPSAAIYLSARQHFNLKEKLTSLRKKLETEGIKIEELQEKIGAEKGVTSKPQGYIANFKGEGERVLPLFILSTPQKASLSSSYELAINLFRDETQKTSSLLDSTSFQKAKSRAEMSGKELTVGYIDIGKGIKQLETVLAVATKGTDITPADLPLDALLFTGDMKQQSFWTSGYVQLNDKLQKYPEISKFLEMPSHSMTPSVGETAVASIGVSQSLLQLTKQGILQSLDAQKVQQAQKYLELLDGVSTLRLGVTKSAPDSLFPGIFIDIASDKAETVAQNIQTLLNVAIQSGQAPLTPWQKKEVAGSQVSYSLSPLGVGLYLAQTDGKVTLASSEIAMKGLLSQKKQSSLSKFFGESAEKAYSKEPPLFFTHIDGGKLGDLISSAQGNLALFTGGQNPVDQNQIDQVKSMGNILWSLSYKDKGLTLHGIQKPATGASG